MKITFFVSRIETTFAEIFGFLGRKEQEIVVDIFHFRNEDQDTYLEKPKNLN